MTTKHVPFGKGKNVGVLGACLSKLDLLKLIPVKLKIQKDGKIKSTSLKDNTKCSHLAVF